MSQIKLAFAGPMRSGKDTAADYMVRTFGATNLKFAGPIYDILRYAQRRCRLEESKDRFFLQWVGTEWGRETINQNIWVDLLFKDAAEVKGPIVISDARFTNEFRTLQYHGFKVIKIERDPVARLQHEPNAEQVNTTHASERDVSTYSLFDAVIWNDCTLEDLYNKIDGLVMKFFPIEGSEFKMTPMQQIQHAEDKELVGLMLKAELKEAYSLLDRLQPSQITERLSMEGRILSLKQQLAEMELAGLL